MSVEMRPEMKGIGIGFPKWVITSDQTAQTLVDAREAQREKDPSLKPISFELAKRALRRFGIGDRHFCSPEEASSDIGTIAAADALGMAQLDIKDIKNMPYATGLQDHMGVPTGTIVMKNLHGNYEAATADISGACPGFIHALRTVYTDMTSPYGLGSPQMVIASEPASKGISTRDTSVWMLFGDAAGAVVLDMEEVDSSYPRAAFVYGMDPDMLHDLYVPAGGSREVLTEESIRLGRNLITMPDGEKVKKAAISNMCISVERVLQKTGLSLADIDLVIPHQANLEIIKGVARNLEVPDEKLYINIHRYGNTSAATIPVAMKEAWQEGRLKRGDILLAVTFGAGLNFAAAVLPMNGLPDAS